MILITGAAGFIGFHTARALLARGETVVGIDNINDYYDVTLKRARLAELQNEARFHFHTVDIADATALRAVVGMYPAITHVVHLAAQAGVRYSITHPDTYAQSNMVGHLNMLELVRHMPHLQHCVYASSSSVYGNDTVAPFAEDAVADKPISLYAATKRASEMLSYSYAAMYKTPLTGLRFFTAYGPWGRPDMAYYMFTKALHDGTPLTLFNSGQLRRDFTYIDDIVAGVLAAIERPSQGQIPHVVYNLGHHDPVRVIDFVRMLEGITGRTALIQDAPMVVGDVFETYADITRSQRDLGFNPTISLKDGLTQFVSWYKQYHSV